MSKYAKVDAKLVRTFLFTFQAVGVTFSRVIAKKNAKGPEFTSS